VYDKKFIGILPFWFRGAEVKHVLLITGPPGVGKTTILTKTVNILRQRGFKVGGMLSREVRENGVRVGFEIQDLSSERRGWLANKDQQYGPQVGKYHVNIADLDAVGANAILYAVEDCDIVAIDEVGPMELFSQKFRDAVEEALKSCKTAIAVVHWKVKDRLIEEMEAREDLEIFTVTAGNRDSLDRIISEKIR
jgi:nucleoside-triphosphatase